MQTPDDVMSWLQEDHQVFALSVWEMLDSLLHGFLVHVCLSDSIFVVPLFNMYVCQAFK